jgi:hypothetical protein
MFLIQLHQVVLLESQVFLQDFLALVVTHPLEAALQAEVVLGRDYSRLVVQGLLVVVVVVLLAQV